MRQTKMLHVWIDPELKDRLDAEAKRIHVSTSALIRKGIEMCLANSIVDTCIQSDFELKLATMIMNGASDNAKWQFAKDSVKQGIIEKTEANAIYDRLHKTGKYSEEV